MDCFLTYKSKANQIQETQNKKNSKCDLEYIVNEISNIIIIIVKRGESIRFSKNHWGHIRLTQYQMDFIVKGLKKKFPDSIIYFEIISTNGLSSEQFLTADLY
jgi:hypothetical protein